MGRWIAATALLLASLAISACGPTASAEPQTSERPSDAPVETPTAATGGSLDTVGPLDPGILETSTALEPRFTFEFRAGGWESVSVGGASGFALARPNLLRADAIIGLVVPVAESTDAFAAELDEHAFLPADAVVEDLTVGGVPARSWSVVRPTSGDAFRVVNDDQEVLTAFGGDMAENRFVFVAHPDRPFVLILSLGPDATPEDRFVFDGILESITFG